MAQVATETMDDTRKKMREQIWSLILTLCVSFVRGRHPWTALPSAERASH